MWALKRYSAHAGDHVRVRTSGKNVVLESEADTSESGITLSGQAEDDPETSGSLLSNDYLENVMAGPLSRHQKQITLSMAFGEEFPIVTAAELPGFEDPTGDDGDTAGGGTIAYTQAPRIQTEVN